MKNIKQKLIATFLVAGLNAPASFDVVAGDIITLSGIQSSGVSLSALDSPSTFLSVEAVG